MANTPEFRYAPMFQLGPDNTEYYLLTTEGVSVSEFEGKPILKVAPEALTALTRAAFRDVSFMLRRSRPASPEPARRPSPYRRWTTRRQSCSRRQSPSRSPGRPHWHHR